jgi:hypothetical protein
VKGEDKVDGDGDDRRGAVEMKHLTICNVAWWMLAESRAKPKS